jgi:hypothetical protein
MTHFVVYACVTNIEMFRIEVGIPNDCSVVLGVIGPRDTRIRTNSIAQDTFLTEEG